MESPAKTRILVLAMCVGAVWGVSGFALLAQSEFLLYRLAVIPRDFGSLPGIVGMPFVHGSWLHLISNTMPLLILGGMVMFRGVRYFGAVTFMIMLLGGLLLWCFGRSNAHIGASGLAFGYLGFLVTRGFYERSWQSIGVAALVVFLYGRHDLRRGASKRRRILGGPSVRPPSRDCRGARGLRTRAQAPTGPGRRRHVGGGANPHAN